jgi:single-stranded-DNA-specific exonuclease
MYWQNKTETIPQDIDELKNILLQNRGLTTKEQQRAFFHSSEPLKLTPEDVGIDQTQLNAAVARILQARDNKEEVVIFGDYDADGVCATAILWEALREIGLIAKPFLPHREKHGYGLTLRSLDALLEDFQPSLIITVDNGIVAHAAFSRLKEMGIDTILTDHHQPEVQEKDGQIVSKIPDAGVLLHSTQICGSGVSWFLAKALSPDAAQKSLELLALATVGDQMKLLGPNRSFVVHGMGELRKTERIGLKLLMSKAKVEPEKINTDTLNYVLVPRINAMGRLKHSLDALRLVCTTNIDRAMQLVEELNTTNSARQELTSDMIDHAMEQAERWKEERIIVVADESYHEGVIGLLAGKLAEEYSKPAIAIAIGAKVAKASARSLPGINITELFRQVKDDLLEAGGHPMAGGFALLPEKVEVVRQRLELIARTEISVEQLTPTLYLESSLPVELMTIKTAQELLHFAPFGQGNEEPIFAFPTATVLGAGQIGKEGRHLKVEVLFATENQPLQVSCIAWGIGHKVHDLPAGTKVKIAGCLSINEWKNRKSLQIMVKDIVAV